MGLRDVAAADLKTIVEDQGGFGWPVTVTNPAGVTADLVGLTTDTHLTIDPDTGQAVSGRNASVALPIAALEAANLGMPENVPDTTRRPWVVVFNDVNGRAHMFKVTEALPDRAIGVVVCHLGAYERGPSNP